MAEDEQKPEDHKQAAADLQEEIEGKVASVFDREITPQEFYYILSCYPYLEICDADYPYIDDKVEPKITIHENTNWKIIDYGSVLATGACELLTKKYRKPGGARAQVEAEAEVEEQEGSGTIALQYQDMAELMINLAMEKGWSRAEIISGFYPMQRIAWILAEEKGYTLKGFDATPEDVVVQGWITRLRQGKLYPPGTPIVTPGVDDELRLD